MFWLKRRDSAASRSSVTNDWYARLPAEKKAVFDSIVRGWEDAYAIFSVSLDDALSLRAEGKIVRARHCALISAGSIHKLAAPLSTVCRVLARAGRHLPSPPVVAPLNPGFYRGETARQSAQWNQLMHHVLFGSRSRLLHKLRVLEMAVCDLKREFCELCEDLPSSSNPASLWRHLDELQYDVNTSLREIVVVLKAVLLALPANSVAAFHNEVKASILAALEEPQPSRALSLQGRRADDFRRE